MSPLKPAMTQVSDGLGLMNRKYTFISDKSKTSSAYQGQEFTDLSKGGGQLEDDDSIKS